MSPAGEPSTSSSTGSTTSTSRAMDIPSTISPYHSRRRRGRYSKIPSPIPRSDSHAGPSSSSLSSDASWSSPPNTTTTRPPRTEESRDPRLPLRMTAAYTDPSTPQRKDKTPIRPSNGSLPPLFPPSTSPLSPSMLASSSYTSVNLNSHHDDPDEPPRLITYTKHGQGFTWNDELFLPSYMIGRYGGRGRRKQYDGDFGEDDVQVVEVFVTDEEAEAMMP